MNEGKVKKVTKEVRTRTFYYSLRMGFYRANNETKAIEK
jgi:hypothetical protein